MYFVYTVIQLIIYFPLFEQLSSRLKGKAVEILQTSVTTVELSEIPVTNCKNILPDVSLE